LARVVGPKPRPSCGPDPSTFLHKAQAMGASLCPALPTQQLVALEGPPAPQATGSAAEAENRDVSSGPAAGRRGAAERPSAEGGLFRTPFGLNAGPESADWLSLFFASYWQRFQAIVEGFVEVKLKPAIRARLPEIFKDSFTIRKFTLGDSAPTFSHMTARSRSNNDATIRVQGTWSTNLTAVLGFKDGLTLGVESISLKAEGAFIPEIAVGDSPQDAWNNLSSNWGVTFYLVDQPDMKLGFSGVANLAELPLIRSTVRSAIQEVICSAIVCPNALTFTLASPNDLTATTISTGSMVPPAGALQVSLQRVESESGDFDFFGLMKNKDERYMTLKLGSTMYKFNNVEIGMQRSLMVHDVRQRLLLDIWDEDYLTADDHLGRAGPFLVQEAVALTGTKVPLKRLDKAGQECGELVMDVVWLGLHSKRLSSHGGIIRLEVRSISLPVDAGSKVKLRARLEAKEVSKTIESGVAVRRQTLLTAPDQQRWEAMYKELASTGMSKKAVDMIQAAQKKHFGPQAKIGLVTVLHLLATAVELDDGVLHLSVLVYNNAEKGGSFTEVGTPYTAPLAKVAQSADLALKGPFQCGLIPKYGPIEVDVDVRIWGLSPADVPESGDC